MLQDPKVKDGLAELADSFRMLKEAVDGGDARKAYQAVKAIKVDADWLLERIRERLGTQR